MYRKFATTQFLLLLNRSNLSQTACLCKIYHKIFFTTNASKFSNNVINVIFEDRHLIVINKPYDKLCQEDQASGSSNVLDYLKSYIKTRDNKPGNVYLSMVHRLDKPTSGLVLFAKTSKAKSRLDAQFRDRVITKKYIAIVEGIIEQQPCGMSGMKTELIDLIKYVPVTGRAGGKSVYGAVMSSSCYSPPVDSSFGTSRDNKTFESKLAFVVLGTIESQGDMRRLPHQCSILDITLHTGRKHQIRIQLQNTGHPIVGDTKYGSQISFIKSAIALHAYQLGFSHPVTHEKMTFQVEPPREWAHSFGSSYSQFISNLFKHNANTFPFHNI